MLKDIVRIYQESSNLSFAINVNEDDGFENIRILTDRTPDAINGIKTLYHLQTEKLLEVKMVMTEKEMLMITKEDEKESKLMKYNLMFSRIKNTHGLPGEQLIKLRHPYEIIKYGSRQAIILMIASKTLYITNPKGVLYNYLEYKSIKEIHIISSQTEFVIKSPEGDFWIQDNEAPFIVREINDVCEVEVGCSAIIKQIDPDEVEFNRIPKITKQKKRTQINEKVENSKLEAKDRRENIIDPTGIFGSLFN